MPPTWLKPRRYRHFDLPINEKFIAKATNKEFVATHSFSPLIHYDKAEKRYKKCAVTGKRTISVKNRPIKYASHRDACILSYYAHQLTDSLERIYATAGFGESVIAYRSLGKSNFDFSAEALKYAKANSPVMILAFDVTGFFDNLSHEKLKIRLKHVLGADDLPKDWYKVFRFITNFHFINLADLSAHAIFGSRLKEKGHARIAGMAELKKEGIQIHPNPEFAKGFSRGIPQGTPISAVASNLYMIDFDKNVQDLCIEAGALYRRYSDDILVICKPSDALRIEENLKAFFAREELEISAHKTEKNLFGDATSLLTSSKAAQYLGFSFDISGAAIRESSLSRQWRKMRRAMKRAKKASAQRVATGGSGQIYTKKLYRRFSHLKVADGPAVRIVRNFSSYGRRSAKAFGSDEKIIRQVRRFERAAQRELMDLKSSAPKGS